MTHPNARQQEIERESRRRQVAAFLLSGVTDQTLIASKLGVSQPTISRDIKVIEDDWRAAAAADVSAVKGLDLQRIERLIAACWNDATKGNYVAVGKIKTLLDRKAAMMGYDSPTQLAVSGDSGPTRLIVEYAEAPDGR